MSSTTPWRNSPRPQLRRVVAPPAKLHRLPLGELQPYGVWRTSSTRCDRGLPVVEERTQAQEKHGVAGVQCERNWSEWSAARRAAFRSHNVVMNEEGVVQKLDRHSDERARRRARSQCGCSGTSSFRRAVGGEDIEVRAGFAGRNRASWRPKLRAGIPRGARLRAVKSPCRKTRPQLYGFVSSRIRTLMKPAGW